MDIRIIWLYKCINFDFFIIECFILKYIESGIKVRKFRIYKSRMLYIVILGVIFLVDVLKM